MLCDALFQRDIIIIASLIEEEAGADSERATIASVIYNRLERPAQGTNGLLQINASTNYGALVLGTEPSKTLDSPYNTYLYKGLPAGPITNPGLASIQAALNPEKTSYYYYALHKDKTHRFFKTYEEHNKFTASDEYGG